MTTTIHKTNQQAGFIGTLTLFVIALFTAIPIFFSSGADLQGNATNSQRKTDASNLASATAEYITNNSGDLPTAFQDGKLSGGDAPVAVDFGHYQTAQVESGVQQPLKTDELWLVTGATCTPQGGTAAGSPRAYVVMYTQEEAGGLVASCLEG